MISVLVDTNVLIDVLQNPDSDDWSGRNLVTSAAAGELIVNPVVWAELAGTYRLEIDLDVALAGLPIRRDSLPMSVAHAAGLAHLRYRRLGGTKERTLPDFLIGAHALTAGFALLTRDASRYRTYFPELNIIAPDTHP